MAGPGGKDEEGTTKQHAQAQTTADVECVRLGNCSVCFYQSTGRPTPIWLSSDRHGVCLPYQWGFIFFLFLLCFFSFSYRATPGRRSRVILTYRTSASFEPHLPHVLCWTSAAFGRGDEMAPLPCAKNFGPGAAPMP